MSEARYYIGIMSGTSADGADLALVEFTENTQQKCQLLRHFYQAYDKALHQKVTDLYTPQDNEIDRLAVLDVELSHFYATAVKQLLLDAGITADQVIAIGNHGQTIRHRPTISVDNQQPFTLQIGCHQRLACLTGIRVIGDFRTKDIALGGQGAPLVPAFHQYLFQQPQQDTFIVNLGGIANITYLPADPIQQVIGFDTGPANALMDSWCNLHRHQNYDENGQWAASGKVCQTLLSHLLTDPYFSLPAPKSTGREYFHLAWLEEKLKKFSLSAVDVQATLSALTATSISQQIIKLSPKAFVYLCGGGVENTHCYKQIKQSLNQYRLETINSINLNNNAFEAMAFAWLAFAYDKKIYGNMPSVTGANKQTVLGVSFNP